MMMLMELKIASKSFILHAHKLLSLFLSCFNHQTESKIKGELKRNLEMLSSEKTYMKTFIQPYHIFAATLKACLM